MEPMSSPFAPPSPGAAAPESPLPTSWTPTRVGVFGRSLWRVAVICVAGGAAVGLVIGVVVALVATEDSAGGRAVAPLLVAYFGAAFGVVLSIVAAPMVAGLLAWRLVPYAGRDVTVRRARLIGTGFIAVVAALIVATVGTGRLPWAGIGALSTLGAWLSSPLLVRWYVRRMDPTP